MSDKMLVREILPARALVDGGHRRPRELRLEIGERQLERPVDASGDAEPPRREVDLERGSGTRGSGRFATTGYNPGSSHGASAIPAQSEYNAQIDPCRRRSPDETSAPEPEYGSLDHPHVEPHCPFCAIRQQQHQPASRLVRGVLHGRMRLRLRAAMTGQGLMAAPTGRSRTATG
jgi:hypothetical protein